MVHQRFDRELAAFDKPLDKREVACVSWFSPQVRRIQQRPQPVESGDERCPIVDAHDPAASREGERLQDTGKRNRGRQLPRIHRHQNRPKPVVRWRERTQTFTRQQLVARDRGCGGGMTRKPEPFLHERRDHRRTVTNGENAVNRSRPGQLENRPRRCRLVRETDRNRPVPPGILEHIAAVGREDQIHAETFGRVAERARLISGRRGEEKNSWHEHPALSALSGS